MWDIRDRQEKRLFCLSIVLCKWYNCPPHHDVMPFNRKKKKLPKGFDSCLAAKRVLGKITNSRESMMGQNLSPGNSPGQFGQGLTSCFPKSPQQTLPTSFCACIFQWSSWALSDLISGALSIIWSQRLLRVLFAHSYFQKSIEIYFQVSKINSGY